MAAAENVKVAVRVRPFNSRETARNATLIIAMNGNSTEIKNPEDLNSEPKRFAFDHSYWSHSEYNERSDGYLEASGSKYADQQRVFDDLGRGVLDNAWKGYNCSLFAYGQTGSGKSYSMVGYGSNKGIVPIFCDEIFKGIEEKRKTAGKDEDYQVSLSMLEIYNEQVRDLLNAKSMTVKGGLKVRQHPSKGFYVENLTACGVNSYKEIDGKINDGTRNRTVAATNMNATSSRAHTIVAITFTQKQPNETGQSMTRTSTVNLVDLAGSERADSTGATGDRLKEGSAINQSLSSLGNVIKALADQSMGKKKVVVPYRDSTLTRLLQNALGGNSKTIMIAALSPADINYEETLSTLRFADRAKAIKTTATINESPTDKLIRELREENAKLMEMLKSGGVVMAPAAGSGGGSEEIEEMKRQMEEELRKKEEELENLTKSYEQRMAESAQSGGSGTVQMHQKEEGDKKVIPHFWNLNEDPALTGMIVHFIKPGKNRLGNKTASPPPEIQLNGLSIQKDHCEITNKDGNVAIKPSPSAQIMINGAKITKETKLSHNDRVSFGPNHLYVFHHPQDYAKKVNAGEKVDTPTFDTAQEEIAKQSGLMTASDGTSKDDLLLQEDLIQMLPMVGEATAMAEELKKGVKFEITLVSPQARGQKDGKTEVMVKMIALDGSGNDWLWDRNKFINRKFLMQEMYQNYVEGDADWDVPQDKDPFWEPADVEKLIGTTHVLLQSMAYNIDLEENLVISDYKGNDQGHLDVAVVPCTKDFTPVPEDDFVEDPKELKGKPVYCKIVIKSARGLPSNIDKSFCRYKFYLDKDYTQTKEIAGTINPDFQHENKITVKSATEQFIEYLNSESLYIEVWGRQKDRMGREKTVVAPKAKDKGDKKGGVSNGNAGAPLPPIGDNKAKEEANMYKKQAAESDKKLTSINDYLKKRKAMGHDAMRMEDVEALLAGRVPPGRPVQTPATIQGGGGGEADGSKACTIQ
ncbi:kinesin-like protein KIF28P [Ruditapes philippinarum]|uniref:kinesin-like protein KIF28P n=1 Tax=Ruditapes philippinarum TaxID=129788 RepID=UPI00295AEAAE|nr:kinesin-like protein KIF28P [Ruditapes philippinarum]